VVRGSWFVVRGSWFVVRGSWFVVRGSWFVVRNEDGSSVSRRAQALIAIAAIALPLFAFAQTVTFVACPIYRDTDAGRKSGCWLADDPRTGARYDVSDALVKPLLGREVLVEGVITQGDANACGGVVMGPVSVSVLNSECKAHLIPAEGHPSRRFVLPAKTLQPINVPRVAPPPPYETREYSIYFELNGDFLLYQHSEVIIDEAVTYIKAARPKRVMVTGYADTQGFDASGQRIRESMDIARARAAMLTEALLRLGVEEKLIVQRTSGNAPDDELTKQGLKHAAKRRAMLRVEMPPP
jgi:outer membrane protein OmpA-like peptidoglycan-associated protein